MFFPRSSQIDTAKHPRLSLVVAVHKSIIINNTTTITIIIIIYQWSSDQLSFSISVLSPEQMLESGARRSLKKKTKRGKV